MQLGQPRGAQRPPTGRQKRPARMPPMARLPPLKHRLAAMQERLRRRRELRGNRLRLGQRRRLAERRRRQQEQQLPLAPLLRARDQSRESRVVQERLLRNPRRRRDRPLRMRLRRRERKQRRRRGVGSSPPVVEPAEESLAHEQVCHSLPRISVQGSWTKGSSVSHLFLILGTNNIPVLCRYLR